MLRTPILLVEDMSSSAKSKPSKSQTPVFRRSFNALLIASTLALPGAAGAQALRDPLSIPARTVSCRDDGFVVRSPLKAAAHWFEIGLEKEPNDRAVQIAFDSTGTPQVMAVYQWTENESRNELIGVGVRFVGDSVTGWRVRSPSGDSLAPQVATKDGRKIGVYRESLDPQSLREARVLANWLWGHRCAGR